MLKNIFVQVAQYTPPQIAGFCAEFTKNRRSSNCIKESLQMYPFLCKSDKKIFVAICTIESIKNQFSCANCTPPPIHQNAQRHPYLTGSVCAKC